MTASLSFRLVRATAFAVVCAGLGVFAHIVAGGTVSLGSAMTGFTASFAAGALVSGRERGPAAVLALLTTLQVALHLLFSLAHTVSTPDLASPALAGGSHAHAGLLPGLGMLVMHGWAVGLTALWLARGEAALWALVRRIGVRLGLRLPLAPGPIVVPFHAVPPPCPLVLRSALLDHVVSGRGPPLSLRTV